MSFSHEVKTELCSVVPETDALMALELAVILAWSGRITGDQVRLTTSHPAVRDRMLHYFDELLGMVPEVSQGKDSYTLHLAGEFESQAVNSFVRGALEPDPLTAAILRPLPETPVEQGTILRAVFLIAGSMTDPDHAYHLEITCYHQPLADYFCQLLHQLDIIPHEVKRHLARNLYIKDSEAISTFLAYMGAYRSMLRFESLRVEKDMRNSINRMVNCDAANAMRIAEAGVRQHQQLSWFSEHYGLAKLPAELAAAAQLRLAYPSLSLRELGEKLDPPLTKSGVNHRLKRLERLVKEAWEAEKGQQREA
ncbi:MAG: DNA-binding protein WhiA [Oscillospiraceae bacterium]|nr:DNA-binding protein WhiA [Oscillospiraceae bacterium]MDD4367686.1 DNA-binding protein WhiA [Oscillospiraceae bacterium]